jgi:NAD(P)-dependent dehydrogenase (short-subunit alcohol dehydrogenase family)
MRLELMPFSIHVAIIEPGYIPSNMQNAATELSSSYVERAEKSPYRFVYEGFRTSWGRVIAAPKYTPDDCARVILRAIQETPPRPRYPVTSRAYVVKWMKRLLSDRALDRLIAKDYGIKPAASNS